MAEWESGDRVTVRYRDKDDDGNQVWVQWFHGVYLTTENVGNGKELRIKNSQTDQHVHLRPNADDIRIQSYE